VQCVRSGRRFVLNAAGVFCFVAQCCCEIAWSWIYGLLLTIFMYHSILLLHTKVSSRSWTIIERWVLYWFSNFFKKI
jgi:hypothetical protein